MLPRDEVGRGAPVVLLHAGIADRTMWAEHLEPLARAGYRALALDLPGFGEAPVAPGKQAPWEDVLVTLDELAIAQAAVVGNSFGGAVGLRAAVVASERVSALALISAPPPDLEPSPELAAAWDAEEAALAREDIEAAVRVVVDTWILPDAPAALRDRVAAMQRRGFALQAAAPAVEEAADPLEDRPDALRAVGVPAVVAVGEHDKPEFQEGALDLARQLPRARHAVIPGAGHLAPLEAPNEFRDLLLDFLDGAQSAGSARAS